MLRWTDNRDLRRLIQRMNELRALRDSPRDPVTASPPVQRPDL